MLNRIANSLGPLAIFLGFYWAAYNFLWGVPLIATYLSGMIALAGALTLADDLKGKRGWIRNNDGWLNVILPLYCMLALPGIIYFLFQPNIWALAIVLFVLEFACGIFMHGLGFPYMTEKDKQENASKLA